MKRILIVGNVPPPIGGVTIHVARLLKVLSTKDVDFDFFEVSFLNVPILFFKIFGYEVIHLQTSSSYLRIVLLFWCRLFYKKTVFTFHGDVGRYNHFRNLCDFISFKLATVPIVLNKRSFEFVSAHCKSVKQISAFIPETEPEELTEDIYNEIVKLKEKYSMVFCANASAFIRDKKDLEIYQVSTLVDIFTGFTDLAIVISDPTCKNFENCKDKIGNNENIFFITEIHDFNSILKLSDCLIRYTTTDGDAISVNEAIYWGKNVIASNVVDRPYGVELVELNPSVLRQAILNFKPSVIEKPVKNNVDDLINLYKLLGVKRSLS